MNLLDKAILETGVKEIKEIDCNNCLYSFYDVNDSHEYQKCAIIRMQQKPKKSQIIIELMRKGILQEFGCCACEYFDIKNKSKEAK